MVEVNEDNLDVLLLDRDNEVILSSSPGAARMTRIALEERHCLQDFGTEALRREFKRIATPPEDDPI